MKDFDKWLDSLTEDLQPEGEKTTWPQAPLAPWHEEVIRELKKSTAEDFREQFLQTIEPLISCAVLKDEYRKVLGVTNNFPPANGGCTHVSMKIFRSGMADVLIFYQDPAHMGEMFRIDLSERQFEVIEGEDAWFDLGLIFI